MYLPNGKVVLCIRAKVQVVLFFSIDMLSNIYSLHTFLILRYSTGVGDWAEKEVPRKRLCCKLKCTVTTVRVMVMWMLEVGLC